MFWMGAWMGGWVGACLCGWMGGWVGAGVRVCVDVGGVSPVSNINQSCV